MSDNDMEITIPLQFDKTITRLAGFPYGQEIYEEQVLPYMDFSKPVRIVFPDQIVKIGSSFVQGFFSGIAAQIGVEGIGKQVQVSAGSPALLASIMKNLL